MTKYLLKRILHGLVSIVIVVALVMIMIYTMLDRNLVFAGDTKYSHTSNNARVAYKYSKWEDYGYLDYVTYSDWLNELVSSGELTEEERSAVVGFEEPRHRILSRSVNMSKNSQSIISLRDTR